MTAPALEAFCIFDTVSVVFTDVLTDKACAVFDACIVATVAADTFFYVRYWRNFDIELHDVFPFLIMRICHVVAQVLLNAVIILDVGRKAVSFHNPD